MSFSLLVFIVVVNTLVAALAGYFYGKRVVRRSISVRVDARSESGAIYRDKFLRGHHLYSTPPVNIERIVVESK